ncbi:MAG: C40 family peptidase [Lewinellaceae bacterium]|nr:C40 family peptidase [Saprospiraceae bacterium]MCB9333307.1 C40 family peptidase [Lewinellaceae bacterium]
MHYIRSVTFIQTVAALAFIALLSGCYTAQKNIPTPPPPSAKELQLRQEIVRYAQNLRGSNYKYAGTTPRTGFDCSGFTSYVLKQFSVPVSTSSAAQAKEGREIPLKAIQPGDLIIFGKNRNNIQHVAMVVETNRQGIFVVHSTTSRGVIQENISTSSYWEPLILLARDVISK